MNEEGGALFDEAVRLREEWKRIKKRKAEARESIRQEYKAIQQQELESLMGDELARYAENLTTFKIRSGYTNVKISDIVLVTYNPTTMKKILSYRKENS